MKQERNLLLTNVYLSNLKKKCKCKSLEKQPTTPLPKDLWLTHDIEFQRKIPISRIKAATKSTVEGCYEFIVHVKQEYDYRFVCEE